MDPLALRSLFESTTSCTVDSYKRTYAGIFYTKLHAAKGVPLMVGGTALAGAQMLFEILCLSAEAFTLRAELAQS